MSSARQYSTGGRAGAALERLLFLDAGRGAAMLFVFASHFGQVYFRSARQAMTPQVIYVVCMIASPTFVIISGFLLGFLYATRAGDIASLRRRLVDRGLFLLSAGHLILLGANLLYGGTARHIFITDTMGACVIAGVYLIDRVGPRMRVVLGIGTYLAGWMVLALWHPAPAWALLIKDAVFGTYQTAYLEYSVPLLPWLGIHLCGSALGEHLGRADSGRRTRIWQTLLKASVLSLGLAASVRAAYEILVRITGSGWHGMGFLQMLASVHQKNPPSPVYALFYGGCGLGMLALVALVEQRQWAPRALKLAALLGRNSFFAFATQAYVYYALLYRLALPISRFWPIYLVASAGFVVTVSVWCNLRGYGRFLTVGYPFLHVPRMSSDRLAATHP